ncbi:conserved hypothetical protein [Methanothermobacter sp. MT-2]|nr:conserved hypothetical protein [Methanothermobacter sp. MT-2]HHW04314.1 phosphatidylserine/phosphatidylglycerophosphate/cardiolipin synthase family protein [Methanothermobacter sp.]
MIYLLIVLGGVGLLIMGLYLMTFGFGIPPNFGLFLLGLCLFVIGMLMVILFADKINLQSLKVEMASIAPEGKPTRRRRRPIPKTVKRPRSTVIEKLKTEIETIEDKGEKETPSKEKVKETPPKKSPEKPKRMSDALKKSKKKAEGSDVVKERLKSLKKEHVKGGESAEDLIGDSIDPFKGIIDNMKSESKAGIIWSFDASDVHDTMRDILTGASESIMIMYPWIRNLDVSILKKFMDTKSRIIIQEASLDDEASVELVKLLLDNNVDIRTMPYIHTVAAVADNKTGLIISTDPIYDSFEVGVIYNDKKSVKEIEKLFEKAWSLSEEISLGG